MGPVGLKYAVEQRLRLMDFLLANYGWSNRLVLMDYFGISAPQASRDISDYMHLAPLNVAYDKSAKRYVRTKQFERVWP